MENKKIGLIGFGTIGKYLFRKIAAEKNLETVFIYDPFVDKKELAENKFIENLGEHIAKADLIVEVANKEIVEVEAVNILKQTNFMPFSVSAFSDTGFYFKALDIAKSFGNRLFIPHGAVIGLDGLVDGLELIDSVEITTIKKPKGFGRNDEKRTIIYEGDARGACEAFPKNVNVHGLLALAGLGFEKTTSKIISDPDIKGNTHNIIIKGNGFKFKIDIESIPKGNVSGSFTLESAFGSIKRAVGQNQGSYFV